MRAIPDAKIGVTGLGRLGQDGDLDGVSLSLGDLFQQRLQRRVVTLLAGVAALGEVGNGVKIGEQRFFHFYSIFGRSAKRLNGLRITRRLSAAETALTAARC